MWADVTFGGVNVCKFITVLLITRVSEVIKSDIFKFRRPNTGNCSSLFQNHNPW